MKDNEIYNQVVDDIFNKIINNEISGIKMEYPPEALMHVFKKLKKQVSVSTDEDEENYEFAKKVFEIEEGYEPNMDHWKEMNAVATLQVGIKYGRKYKI